jgi:hypothetical protein
MQIFVEIVCAASSPWKLLVEVFGVGRSVEVVWRRRRHEVKVKVNDASFAEALEAHGALTSKRF